MKTDIKLLKVNPSKEGDDESLIVLKDSKGREFKVNVPDWAFEENTTTIYGLNLMFGDGSHYH